MCMIIVKRSWKSSVESIIIPGFSAKKSFERPLRAHQSEPLSTCTSTYEAWIAQPQSKRFMESTNTMILGGKKKPPTFHPPNCILFSVLSRPQSRHRGNENACVLAKTPAVSGLTNPSAWNSSHMLNGCRVAAKDKHSRDWLIAVKKNDKWTNISWFSGG